MKFLLSVLLLTSLPGLAQDSLNNIGRIFMSADSVIIVKHETLLVFGKPGRPSTTKKIALDGKPNYSIIKEIQKLDSKSIDTLVYILTKHDDGDFVTMSCFEPHHAIYIFNKDTLSYFDICFGCHQMSISKDIILGGHEFTNTVWAELESFFKNKGINNKGPF